MTFKSSSFEQLCYMLSYGVFAQQVNAGEEDWTYDDEVWGLQLDEVALASIDDTVFPYSVLIFPATCEKTDNGMFYSMVDGAD